MFNNKTIKKTIKSHTGRKIELTKSKQHHATDSKE